MGFARHRCGAMTNETNVKVLYVIGKGRSGGTLLNNLLGQVEGFVSIGELTRFWTWGLQDRALCGCGSPVPDCPFWTEVLTNAFGKRLDRGAARTIDGWERKVSSWWAAPRMFAQSARRPPSWKPLRNSIDATGRIYRALAETAGARVIVETTKWPASPTALNLIPGVDSYLLHLVRDPRAVIYAWRKRDKRWVDHPENPSVHFGSLYSMASWWGRNFLAEAARVRRGRERYKRCRYEDFIAQPKESLQAICAWLGEPDPDLSFISGATATITPTHTSGGNPNRLRAGPIEIRVDDEWLARQPVKDRILGTLLATPFLQLYRYPLVPSRPK